MPFPKINEERHNRCKRIEKNVNIQKNTKIKPSKKLEPAHVQRTKDHPLAAGRTLSEMKSEGQKRRVYKWIKSSAKFENEINPYENYKPTCVNEEECEMLLYELLSDIPIEQDAHVTGKEVCKLVIRADRKDQAERNKAQEIRDNLKKEEYLRNWRNNKKF